jgi:hypothetical protein
MGGLSDYEEGVLIGKIKIRANWWEFWKPKFINYDIGNYTRIGNQVQFNIKVGDIWVSGNSEKGLVSGMIKGLPGGQL